MNLISIHEIEKNFIDGILLKADGYKKRKKASSTDLAGKTVALIFEKPSARTRVSFEVAMFQLGGAVIYLDRGDIQLGVRESVSDVARVLSRYVEGIVLRTFAHSRVLEMAEASTVPVINGLSDRLHPCQVLSDIYTAIEKKGEGKLKVAFVGDGNNVCHSWLYGASKFGWDLSIATPRGYEPLREIVREAREDAEKTGAKIEVMNDAGKAVRGADIIYTDVWVSMGKENEREKRIKDFSPFRVDEKLLQKSGKKSLIMHCLPAHRGEEITDKIMDGPNSIVFDQAENRLYVQKAILSVLLK